MQGGRGWRRYAQQGRRGGGTKGVEIEEQPKTISRIGGNGKCGSHNLTCLGVLRLTGPDILV
jgi:hypothetical protein